MPDHAHLFANLPADRRAFYEEWLENHGVVERPTADQLLRMDEDFQAHSQRWRQARAGKGYRPLS